MGQPLWRNGAEEFVIMSIEIVKVLWIFKMAL